eukprot:15433128-Alexandrium_andersonii.AAC.1
MQFPIHARPLSAAIRLNPQSAMRKVQRHFRRSELELRGPRDGLKFGPRNSRWVHPARLFAQIPNPLT